MRRTLIALVLIVLIVAIAVPALALDAPAPTGRRVNDLADMISPSLEQKLEAVLAELEATDSTQMAILTIPTLDGDSLEEFAIRVAHDSWKLGQEKEDNGVLLLIAKAEHKVRIEVGYGLEGVLTDTLSGSIIDNEITPAFKTGNFDQGIAAGTLAIVQAVRGEYIAAKKSTSKRGGRGLLFPVIIVIFGIAHLLTPRGKPKVVLDEHGNKVVQRSGMGVLPWIILGSALGRGGGGFGGGGFGGGGFGGGGGGFGGGGASGGW